MQLQSADSEVPAKGLPTWRPRPWGTIVLGLSLLRRPLALCAPKSPSLRPVPLGGSAGEVQRGLEICMLCFKNMGARLRDLVQVQAQTRELSFLEVREDGSRPTAVPHALELLAEARHLHAFYAF